MASRNNFEGDKPYMVGLTANDAYEQDMLQSRLAESSYQFHQEIARNMARVMGAEDRRMITMREEQEHSVRG